MSEWKKREKHDKGSKLEGCISAIKGNRIMIAGDVVDKIEEKIGEKRVEFFFKDLEDRTLIGLKPSKSSDSYKIYIDDNARAGKVSCRVDLKNGRYDLEWDEDVGMFVGEVEEDLKYGGFIKSFLNEGEEGESEIRERLEKIKEGMDIDFSDVEVGKKQMLEWVLEDNGVDSG